MDYLSIIKKPISQELNEFISLFNKSLTHNDGLLARVLEHIRSLYVAFRRRHSE